MVDDKPHYDDHNSGPEWGTPKWIWKPIAETLWGFDLDPASGAERVPIARQRFDIDDNGLERSWWGDVWLNPPYGRKQNPVWAKKALNEARGDRVKSLTALVPASTDTQWFQENYARADLLTFIEGRVSFIGSGDNNASFPSVIVTWGIDEVSDEYIKTLNELGFVAHI